jgi:hypothetical protein
MKDFRGVANLSIGMKLGKGKYGLIKNDVMRNIYMTREYMKTLVTLMQIVVANKSTTHRSKLELV